MTTAVKRIGGTFAPPLDRARLERYRQLAESANGQVRETMLKLCDMLDLFWQTPASTEPSTPHPVGMGVIIPLTKDEIDRIWDAVPWADEIKMYAALFEPIQADVVARNSRRIEDWQGRMREHVVSKHFDSADEHAALIKVLETFDTWERFLTEENKQAIAEKTAKVLAVHDEVTKAIHEKSHPEVPYPSLEAASLRDAAFHLLWFATELEKDREPITNDKL